MTKQQQIRIEISANLSPIGMAIHSLINRRVNFPMLYTGNGSCRKSTLQVFRDHRLKLKSLS